MAGWHHRCNGHEPRQTSGRWWGTGKPGVLQSMGSQSRTWLCDWKTTCDHIYIWGEASEGLLITNSKFVFFFNWSVIALQCFVSFCCATEWISPLYNVCAPPSETSLPLPSPTHLGHHRALNWAPCAMPQRPRASCSHGLPRWLSGEESAYQCRRCRRHRFSPWVRKIPWRRKWQPTLVFLPGESP